MVSPETAELRHHRPDLPPGLPRALLNSLPDDGVLVTRAGNRLVGSEALGVGGAYLLLLSLPFSMSLTIRKEQLNLTAGWYLYAGSAHGPGGLSARVARHMRHDKKPHWHIDAITKIHPPIAALCYPNGAECDLVGVLSQTAGFIIPVQGFGSTDCRTCSSHLLAWRRR